MGREGLGTAGMVAIMLNRRPVDMYGKAEKEPLDRCRFDMSHHDMIVQVKGSWKAWSCSSLIGDRRKADIRPDWVSTCEKPLLRQDLNIYL